MSAPSPAPARNHLPTLAGVRVVGALMVFVNHAGLENVFTSHTTNFLIVGLTASVGESMLGFFFMISGFVLTWSSPPTDTKRKFWRRRLVKIFPNHLVTWALGLLGMLAVGGAVSAWHVLPSMVLLQAWIPSVPVLEGTNGPSWSLSCELMFYLLFPWLLAGVRRIRPERLWWWVIGLTAAIAAVPVAALALPYEPTLFGLPLPFYRFWFIVFLPPVRLLDFLLGIVLAQLMLAGRWPSIKPRWVWVALLAGWAVGVALPVPTGFVAPFVPALILAMCCGVASDLAGRSSALNNRTMEKLGDLSFPFYLLHWLVLHYLHVALGGGSWSPPVAIGYILLVLAVTAGLSWLLQRGVERPAMRRWSRPRRRAPRPSSVQLIPQETA